jgi:hypothetical protein
LTSMTPEDAQQAQAARQLDLDTWRANNAEPPPSPEQVLEDQARNRSQLDPGFAGAWALLAAGFAVLPCDPAGRPLAGAEPIQGTGRLMETWDRHPDAVAAAACGPEHDLVAVAATLDGGRWLVEVSIDPATRRRPPAAPPEPLSVASGVYREPGDARPGPQHRDAGAAVVRLLEMVGPGPRLAAAASGPGERDRSMVEDLAAKLRRPKPTATDMLVWAWPAPEGDRAWTLPVGRRVHSGVELAAAVPADGAVLERDGKRWRVAWVGGLGRRLAMPSWLAAELGGRLQAP